MKNAAIPCSSHVTFGRFELSVRAGELHSKGIRVVLQEQPFRLLLMLISREGDIVTRDEIKKQLWPDGTIVDFDHSINTAIKKLRRLLGDGAKHPQYIQTIGRRGYKFIVPVDWEVTAAVWTNNATVEFNPSDGVTPFLLATVPSRNLQEPTFSRPGLSTSYEIVEE